MAQDGRVLLVTPDTALLDAAVDDAIAFARALRCDVAEGWDVFPEALRATRKAVASNPEATSWGARLFLLEEPRTLVGWGGFKGPPRDGVVELGYAIAPGFEGRGLATAAVGALLCEALAATDVRTVVAHTLAERNASVRVLEKAGFAHEAELPDDELGAVWRFRLDRPGG